MSWRLAGSLQTLRAEILDRFPGTTIWSIGDAAHRHRASDHNINSRGVVCAIDVVGGDQGNALWQFILDTKPDRVKYAIWQRRIVNSTVSPWTPRHYSGSNPHETHIHISVGRGPSGRSNDPHRYDDTSPWGFADTQPKPDPPSPPPDDDAEEWKQEVIDAMRTLDLSNAHNEPVLGPDPKRLQGLLLAWGYGPDGLVDDRGLPDGIAGPDTAGHLETFQSNEGLTVDRIAGEQTWTELLTGY